MPDKLLRSLWIIRKFLFIYLFLSANFFLGEVIRVNVNDPGVPPPEQYKPGFFYNNTTWQANAIFDAASYSCNCLRCNDLAYRLRTSTSYDDFINWVRSLRTLYEHRAQRTSRMVIEVSGMPYWLSSSTDTTPTGSGWRYFQTVMPRNMHTWDNLMRSMAAEIATWSFTPYYEFWNEPDLHDFWNETEAEFIELYKHTALAIKSIDPDAKVGGIAVNGWKKGIGTPNYSVWGYYPDSLAEITCSIVHLIDSCVVDTTPLDFITWHYFSIFPKDFEFAADYYRRKLNSYGMYNTELIITEYNCISLLRETTRQPPLFVRFYNYITNAGIDRHNMAALQDFSYHPTEEFFGDYGSISRSGLCKPVYNAILLIDQVQRSGNLIPVYTDSIITTLASRGGNSLRLLLANFVNYPLYEGYERLLWDVHHVNTIDLANAGYTRWGQIDSTIMGYYPPMGPPEIIAAFEDAHQRYEWGLVYNSTPRSLEIHFSGLTGITNGTICVIDDTHNTMIYKYDSLLNLGYTRQEAVNILYPNQNLEYTNIQVSDSIYYLQIPPNAVVLITLQDLNAVNEVKTPNSIFEKWTMPTILKNQSIITLPSTIKKYKLGVFDVLGRCIIEYKNINNEPIKLPLLPAGVYFAKFETETETRIVKFVIIR